jgi:hypothetical protein
VYLRRGENIVTSKVRKRVSVPCDSQRKSKEFRFDDQIRRPLNMKFDYSGNTGFDVLL